MEMNKIATLIAQKIGSDVIILGDGRRREFKAKNGLRGTLDLETGDVHLRKLQFIGYIDKREEKFVSAEEESND